MNRIKICFVTREYAHDLMGKTGGIGVFSKQFTEQLKYKPSIIFFDDITNNSNDWRNGCYDAYFNKTIIIE